MPPASAAHSNSLHQPLLPPAQSQPSSTKIRKYRIRSTANILGANAFVALYAFIVFYALDTDVQNGIAINRVLSAKLLYYVWFVLAVFALDWAHAGTAVIEVAGILSRHLAPKTAMQTLWHSERSWAGPTGWMKAILSALRIIIKLSTSQSRQVSEIRPPRFWWALVAINVPIWLAVPLSGLSFDFKTALVSNSQRIAIQGVNQTSFEARSPYLLWQTALQRWAQDMGPTEPDGITLFLPTQDGVKFNTSIPESLLDADGFEDLRFFSGPAVDAQVEGRAWGLQVGMTARIVHPSNLTLLSATSFNDWNVSTGASSFERFTMPSVYGCGSTFLMASNGLLEPVYADQGRVAMHTLPDTTLVELILWQYYTDSVSLVSDSTMLSMTSSPFVMKESYWHLPSSIRGTEQVSIPDVKPLLLSFGISIQLESSTGFADLSPRSSTFSDFNTAYSQPDYNVTEFTSKVSSLGHYCSSVISRCDPALDIPTATRGSSPSATVSGGYNNSRFLHCLELNELCQQQTTMNEYVVQNLQGLLNPLQSNVGRILSIGEMLFSGLACLELIHGLVPPSSNSSRLSSCVDPWMSANLATGGEPYFVEEKVVVGLNQSSKEPIYQPLMIPTILRMPAIAPERMRLALIKLVLQLATQMTGPGPNAFEGDLTGFSETPILVSGIIPWQLVLALLVLWDICFTAVTIIFFNKVRFAPTLGAYQLFVFGSEWHNELNDPIEEDFTEATILQDIPSSTMLHQEAAAGIHGFTAVTLRRHARRLMINP